MALKNGDIEVWGLMYDVSTGLLNEIEIPNDEFEDLFHVQDDVEDNLGIFPIQVESTFGNLILFNCLQDFIGVPYPPGNAINASASSPIIFFLIGNWG
ncbi:hypothetical protein QCA50_015746 [Cerrena zonata]|uniref:Carbonic anhydrase n=1 Tax=Cerrena zonata TaxID=2478898 RepID=A0AAW0FK66_9APHY